MAIIVFFDLQICTRKTFFDQDLLCLQPLYSFCYLCYVHPLATAVVDQLNLSASWTQIKPRWILMLQHMLDNVVMFTDACSATTQVLYSSFGLYFLLSSDRIAR